MSWLKKLFAEPAPHDHEWVELEGEDWMGAEYDKCVHCGLEEMRGYDMSTTEPITVKDVLDVVRYGRMSSTNTDLAFVKLVALRPPIEVLEAAMLEATAANLDQQEDLPSGDPWHEEEIIAVLRRAHDVLPKVAYWETQRDARAKPLPR